MMLDSGPYIEQGESRLRARQAVLEGLSESGFVPKDSEHIGFVNWSQDTEEDNETLIPWEKCKVTDDPDRCLSARHARRVCPLAAVRQFCTAPIRTASQPSSISLVGRDPRSASM